MRLIRSVCSSLLAITVLAPAVRAQALEDVMGVAHIQGQYYFGSVDYLNQGANQVLATGSKVIKLEMSHSTPINNSDNSKYRWNTTWPAGVTNLTQLAQTSFCQSVFSKPFHTFVLTTVAFSAAGSGNDPAEYWLNGVTPTQAAKETQEFHDLAKYLMTTYSGSGKVFILENWEGDWAIKSSNRDTKPTPTAVQGMIDWINARQQGIINARNEVGTTSNVKVYGTLEVNRVQDAMNGDIYQDGVGTHTGWATCTNDVLPHTHVDFASYSAYETQQQTVTTTNPSNGRITASFADAIAYLAAHLPATALNGQNTHSVYVGEYGLAEDEVGASTLNAMINNVMDTVVADEMPLACYWEIYSNQIKNETTTPPPVNGNNSAVDGFYLVKPDSTPAVAWHQHRLNIITTSASRANTTEIIANSTLKYTSAFPSSGSALGTGWSTNTNASFNWACLAGNLVQLNYTAANTGFPSGLATLNVSTVVGRALQPGDYVQFTVKRVATSGTNAGAIGCQLFGVSHGSAFPTGAQPLDAWYAVSSSWVPISFAANGSNPTYSWGTTATLGFRLDSTDGDFATVSFYLNGSYVGSNLIPTTATTLNTISLFGQNNAISQLQFGKVQIYFGN